MLGDLKMEEMVPDVTEIKDEIMMPNIEELEMKEIDEGKDTRGMEDLWDDFSNPEEEQDMLEQLEKAERDLMDQYEKELQGQAV